MYKTFKDHIEKHFLNHVRNVCVHVSLIKGAFNIYGRGWAGVNEKGDPKFYAA